MTQVLQTPLKSLFLIHLWTALRSLRGLVSLRGGDAFLKERIAAEKEEEYVELCRRISSNPDFQLPQPPKPQGGMKIQQHKPAWWLKHTMYFGPMNE